MFGVALVLAALLVVACTAAPQPGQSGAEPATQAQEPAAQEQAAQPAEPGQTLKFVAISKSLDNPAFQVAEVGAKDRIEELGGVIELEWTAPTGADPAKEVQMIESYVQRGVDGLLINSLGPAVCQAVNEAMDAGIPVVMWDSDCPDSKRLSYVGSDNYLGGYKSGELYAQAVEGKGHQKIAILTGQPGAFNLQERDRGFKQALDDLGVDYEIVTTVPGFDDLTKSVEAVESTLRGNEEINGFFFDGPWVLLVEPTNTPLLVERVKSGQLTVMSFDTLPQQLKWLDEGLVIGLVGQKYYGWGYQGITVIHNIVANGAQYPPIVNTGVDVVTVEGGEGQFTSAEFAKFWEEFSFKEEPIMPEDVQQ
jgi:ribose transport system substrate-binding protein